MIDLRLAVIVLNWNNPLDTIACLDSLAQLRDHTPWTIIVDNGSTDESVAQIHTTHPYATLLETGTNLGYAGGNNVGIQHALVKGAETICILNNDVVVEPDFLTPLLDALHSQLNVGIVTPLVAERVVAGERVWALGATIDWRAAAVMRQYAGSAVAPWRECGPFEVEIASGAAMLVKREVFERVGMMDESFFLYFEEVDWNLKVRQAGNRILAAPSSVVWHKVSATLGATSPVIDYYMLRNQLYLIKRHWSGSRYLYLLTRTVARNVATIAAYTVKPHQGRRIPHRNARLFAIRDAVIGRWGKMGPDVAKVCYPNL